uniref:DNA polymerase III subunit delta' n=1 Tax=Ndongobacter massiliensis TaxID=1871025 RepID=UPI00093021DF|nr:DNA polymerase III subunit delta' [Ndongobacter massiliensis]
MRLPESPRDLSHAYVITSPDRMRGIAAARAYAKRILCDFGGAEEEKWARGTLPDFWLEEAEKIPIDRIRTICARLYQKPLESTYRVVLLAHADAMRDEAQNALLKSLEEPPLYVVWLLVCENETRLLPTIRSRCRILRIEGKNAESTPIDAQVLAMTRAALAGDRLRVLTDRGFYEDRKEVCAQTLEMVRTFLLLCLKERTQANADIPATLMQAVRETSAKRSAVQWAEALSMVEETRQALDVNVNAVLALEHIFLSLARGQRFNR